MTNSKYDAKLEQARQAISDEWVRKIMNPICCSMLISNMQSLASLDDGHNMEWLLDALQTERECKRCEGSGKIDCDDVNCENGYTGDDEYCPYCADGKIKCSAEGCEDGRVDTGEILEFWIIDDRASHRLKQAGETIISGDDLGIGLDVWGRGCSGQAISSDGVVMRCAEEFAIDCPWILDGVHVDHVSYWQSQQFQRHFVRTLKRVGVTVSNYYGVIEEALKLDWTAMMESTEEDSDDRSDLFEVIQALYWHAVDYHRGQTSELYSLSSILGRLYTPGSGETGCEAGSAAEMLYTDLETAEKGGFSE